MDLIVGEMGFIFCGKHPLLVTKAEVTVSNPGPMGPLIFSILPKTAFFMSVCYGAVK